MQGKKIIIIGASSGIGKALAVAFDAPEHLLGLTARRVEELQVLADQLQAQTISRFMDIRSTEEARGQLLELIQAMNGVDIVIINAGIGNNNRSYEWPIDEATIQTNVVGFCALAHAAYVWFREHNPQGQVVGISSVAQHFGYGRSTAYNASKAFISTYMSGLRHKAKLDGLPELSITDIRPGFIDTPLIANRKGLFWIISADKAAKYMVSHILSRKSIAYVPARWKLVAWLLKRIPERWIHMF